MARALTTPQRDLLRAPNLAMNALFTFYLDAGTYYFCDDVVDMSDGTHTYIGASALTGSIEIQCADPLSSNQVTLTVDGNRMSQYGVDDPAKVLRQMLDVLHQQRRIDTSFGFRYADQQSLNLIVPTLASRINYCRLVDQELSFDQNSGGSQDEVSSRLDIVMDSLAARYTLSTQRTRSNEDQLEIDPTDKFYGFISETLALEKTIYWGKQSPFQQQRFIGAVGRFLGVGSKSHSTGWTGNA